MNIGQHKLNLMVLIIKRIQNYVGRAQGMDLGGAGGGVEYDENIFTNFSKNLKFFKTK